MRTTLVLMRSGSTEWGPARRLLGRRDLSLSPEGRAEVEASVAALDGVDLAEILASPLARAVETAEILATRHRIQIARDPRLIAQRVGAWEGCSDQDLARDPSWRAWRRDPVDTPIPDGESIVAVRDRVLSSVQQALADNQVGATVALVTHASALRPILAHFLGAPLRTSLHLHVAPASLSVLRFDSAQELPDLLAVNHGVSMARVLR